MISMSAQINDMMVKRAIYNSAVSKAREEAQLLSTDYLNGYMNSYEAGRGVIRRTFTRVGNALDCKTESPTIVGFRKVLEERVAQIQP